MIIWQQVCVLPMQVNKQLVGNCWCEWFPLRIANIQGWVRGPVGSPVLLLGPGLSFLMDEVLGQRPSIAPPRPNCLHPWGDTRAKCCCGWPGSGGRGWRGGRESARALQKVKEGGQTHLPHQGGHAAPERDRGEAGMRERSLYGEAVLPAGENVRTLTFFTVIILSFISIQSVHCKYSYDFIFHIFFILSLSKCTEIKIYMASAVERLKMLCLSFTFCVVALVRSFSALCRQKTWLHNTMMQERLIHLAIMNAQ